MTEMLLNHNKEHFFSPFNFSIDKMRQLILISFEKHPDKLYKSFELQQAISENGESLYLVIAYRNDGDADVYHQPDYPIASQNELLNNPQIFSRQLEKTQFKIENNHLEASFSFEDKIGRDIEVKVIEQNIDKKHPFYLLAPIGERSTTPSAFPVYSLYNMTFAKRKSTTIDIYIDHINHKPDVFVIPIDFSINYLTRYSTDIFNVDWNKNMNGILKPLKIINDTKAIDNSMEYDLLVDKSHHKIKSISTSNSKHSIKIEFHPPFPDIQNQCFKCKETGKFYISNDHLAGRIQGNYEVKKLKKILMIKINPNKGWNPHEKRLPLKLLLRFIKVFRNWPKSFIWNACVEWDALNNPVIHSQWSRK